MCSRCRRAGLRRVCDQPATDGMVWVSWPKKSSGIATDLSDVVVRQTALPLGLVDIKVCAIDETWSGLKFVIPRAFSSEVGTGSREENASKTKD